MICKQISLFYILRYNFALISIKYSYETFIIKDSQTSVKTNKHNNIFQNEVYIFAKNVVLASIKDQSVIDGIAIKILSNYVLNEANSALYSKARVIEAIEILPYDYSTVLRFTYNRILDEHSGDTTQANLDEILKNIAYADNLSNDEGAVRLLMTTLVLNNLKSVDEEQSKIDSTLNTLIKVIDWIIQTKNIDLDHKKFLLEMSMDLLIYLLKINMSQSSHEIIKRDGFMTQL